MEWNTLTRHQIIVAHLQLMEDMDKVRQRLAKEFGLESCVLWEELAYVIIEEKRRESK